MDFRSVESELFRRLRRLYVPAIVAGLVVVGVGLHAINAPAHNDSPGDSNAPGIATETQAAEAPTPVSAAPTADATPAEPRTIDRSIAITRGDTLMEALVKAGADRQNAYEAISALRNHFDPRKLQIGQSLDLTFRKGSEAKPQLVALSLQPDIDRTVAVTRDDDKAWTSKVVEKPLQRLTMRAAGRIDDSLFLAAERDHVPPEVIVELIRIFSFDVDFQREIRQGDSYEVYFERFATPDGAQVREGHILFAQLTLGGKPVALYRYPVPGSKRVDYFHPDGTSVHRLLMKTPVDGARLSSRFGEREHPILGYTRMHKGVDFAAPRGTPIMAAGNGVVERASRWGSFGNYIRIRHNGTYETAYAHLWRYGRASTGACTCTRARSSAISARPADPPARTSIMRS